MVDDECEPTQPIADMALWGPSTSRQGFVKSEDARETALFGDDDDMSPIQPRVSRMSMSTLASSRKRPSSPLRDLPSAKKPYTLAEKLSAKRRPRKHSLLGPPSSPETAEADLSHGDERLLSEDEHSESHTIPVPVVKSRPDPSHAKAKDKETGKERLGHEAPTQPVSRVLGSRVSIEDAASAIFSQDAEFQVGEIVLVPRAGHELHYGRVLALDSDKKLVTIQLSVRGTTVKCLPAILVGKSGEAAGSVERQLDRALAAMESMLMFAYQHPIPPPCQCQSAVSKDDASYSLTPSLINTILFLLVHHGRILHKVQMKQAADTHPHTAQSHSTGSHSTASSVTHAPAESAAEPAEARPARDVGCSARETEPQAGEEAPPDTDALINKVFSADLISANRDSCITQSFITPCPRVPSETPGELTVLLNQLRLLRAKTMETLHLAILSEELAANTVICDKYARAG